MNIYEVNTYCMSLFLFRIHLRSYVNSFDGSESEFSPKLAGSFHHQQQYCSCFSHVLLLCVMQLKLISSDASIPLQCFILTLDNPKALERLS